MRRFVTLAVFIFFALPFGISLTGCHHAEAPTYCNGLTSGVQVGQLATLDLEPRLTGISLNQGEIGRANSPSGKDCRGNSAAASNVVYASTNILLADVDPTTGTLCGGSWNRNTNYIADYTVCTPTSTSGVAYITASSSGVVSNPIPVFIHPIVTSIVLGPASANCSTDPASNCVDLTQLSGCDTATTTAPTTTPVYDGLECISQGGTRQLVARTYANNSTSAANNISCMVGPLQFNALNASVATVDANGVATAAQPGSSTITANISQASSNAGFFSTCPPASIVLSVPPSTTAPTTSISVNQNTSQPLTATVLDTNNNPITNLQLEYESTFPITIPAGSNTIVPTYPSAAAITAICQPPNCNSAPFNEIGLYGNGTPVTSNPVQIVSTGTNFSTVLYIASTQSQYIQPVDFTVTTQPTATRLPYVPTSLVISEDTSTIYMGTPVEIMVYSTLTNALTKQDISISGNVLAPSPDNNTVVVTDPVRQLIYLYLAAGGVSSEYGGVATSAAWSPDSSTVYITTSDGRLLVHSTFTGWSSIPLTSLATDVAVTVPNAGAYLASVPVDVRTNCPATVVSGAGLTQTTTNTFYPDLGPVAGVNATVLTATNDGAHILTAYSPATGVSTFTDIKTNQKAGGCPVAFTSNPGSALTLPAGANAVNNVIATSDSAYAFVTYTTTGTTIGVVPQYSTATGTLTPLQLTATTNGTPTAPISGVLSGDNNTLYVGTSGDNVVHRLARGANGFSENTTTLPPVVPALPNFNGPGVAPPNLLVERPRKSTS